MKTIRKNSAVKHSRALQNKVLILLIFVLAVSVPVLILNYFQAGKDVYSPTDMVNNPVFTRRNMIEKEYPEFREFESQKSFAGQSVKYEIEDGDYFFAYMIHGSGIPIVQATCFRVDRAGRVFKIGSFPDPLDSYAGYADVDPKNCKGIKYEEK